MRQVSFFASFFVVIIASINPALAEKAPRLLIALDGRAQTFSASELLSREDIATVEVNDIAYLKPMTYRAVPLRALIGDLDEPGFDTVEARAMDGFVVSVRTPSHFLTGPTASGAI